jgi:hypothetical protein
MSVENILAFQFGGEYQPQEVTPPGLGGVPWSSGLRSILSVRQIFAHVQTTTFVGDSLYMIWYNIGQLSPQDGFKAFLRPYFGHFVRCAQLDRPPFAATPAVYLKANSLPVPPPAPPISYGKIKLLDAGFDAFRGYFLTFEGNFFLNFPIFQNWPNVIRTGPDFQGFQPSANNPGSGNSGSGSGTPPVIPPTTC